jgi:hypothetical protein
MSGLNSDQEKAMRDMGRVTDQVLASIFAPDNEAVRVCKGCGDLYEHPNPAVHLCPECYCGGETCQWRIVKCSTHKDGTVCGTKQCFTPGCGRSKEFEA